MPLGAEVDVFFSRKRRGITRSCQWSDFFDGNDVYIFFLLNIAVHLGLFLYAPSRQQVRYLLIGSSQFGSCMTAHPESTDRKDNSLLCGDSLAWSDMTTRGIHRVSAEGGVAVIT